MKSQIYIHLLNPVHKNGFVLNTGGLILHIFYNKIKQKFLFLNSEREIQCHSIPERIGRLIFQKLCYFPKLTSLGHRCAVEDLCLSFGNFRQTFLHYSLIVSTLRQIRRSNSSRFTARFKKHRPYLLATFFLSRTCRL